MTEIETTISASQSPLGTQPLYRIYWRIGSTDKTGRSNGTFEREIAELWIKSLNADKDNKRLGIVHWIEQESQSPQNGQE